MKFNKCELELSPTINKKELSSKMSKLVKNIIALGVSSALSISSIHNVYAATYQIVDKGEESKLKYTYAQRQNVSGDMAISGTNIYNFPVQFQYLDASDYLEIISYAINNYSSVNTLDNIEDADALVAGNPTANDLTRIAQMTAGVVKMFGMEPVMAMISYSNFGSSKNQTATKVREAVEYLHKRHPNLIVDGELQTDFALNKEMLQDIFPFSKLAGKKVNTLIFTKLTT